MKLPPLIVPIDNRIALLPHHAAYYHRLGFKTFVYALWNGQANPLYDAIPKACLDAVGDGCKVHVRPSIVCDYDHYNGPAETPGLNEIRMEFVGNDDWYCVADLDEFYWFNGKTLEQTIAELEQADLMALHGCFYNRVSRDGSFPAIPGFNKDKPQLDDLFPLVADLSRVTKHNPTKISLARLTGIRTGHHWATLPQNKIRWDGMQVHHFKWCGDLINLLTARYAAYSSQNLSWAYETKDFMEFFQNPDWIHSPLITTTEAQKLGI